METPNKGSSPSQENDLSEIKLLLQKDPVRYRFPDNLEKFFLAAVRKDAISFFRANGHMVLVIFVFLVALEATLLNSTSQDIHYWVISASAIGIAIITALICARISALDKYYFGYISLVAFAGLINVINFPMFVTEHEVVLTGYFSIFYTVMAVYTFSGLHFSTALLINLAAAATIPVVQLFAPYPADYFMLSHSFIGINAMGLILNMLSERQRRRNYLQHQIIRIEKNRADSLARMMEALSRQDKLTGIANRGHFDRVLEQEWSRCNRSSSALSLLFIDVDHFKKYNDHYGHQAGDETLTSIAQLVDEQAKRPGDLAARYGGEEFVIIFPQTSDDTADLLAERLIETVYDANLSRGDVGGVDRITVSIGIATVTPTQKITLKDLIKCADLALYKAKFNGRNRCERLSLKEQLEHGLFNSTP
ncbi:GGDEF domain-containing protein [Aestuariirhabdus sp. Z084]|uniref:GGDEF domain-containing protein n=1 Tax=Aestuariirhabdus haliotis TaxID=2918751 RepID=UPI00201B361D|nr:GGDEF domain-containing protein [Aestuariirhabdus haliotis]MCL6417628.1 GGDEF domain-containing protein [Aestuariirhabdus haliotis]MCL6421554.1 GGDEF domain-containing protein [Aestuariirhabdus haliotis]